MDTGRPRINKPVQRPRTKAGLVTSNVDQRRRTSPAAPGCGPGTRLREPGRRKPGTMPGECQRQRVRILALAAGRRVTGRPAMPGSLLRKTMSAAGDCRCVYARQTPALHGFSAGRPRNCLSPDQRDIRKKYRSSELLVATFLIRLSGRDLIATGDYVTTRSTAETPSPAPSVIPQQCVPPSCIAAQTGPSLPLSPKLRNLRGLSLFPPNRIRAPSRRCCKEHPALDLEPAAFRC